MSNVESTTQEARERPRRLLLVEDDLRLPASIKEYLEENQFSVDVEHRGENAIGQITGTNPDLVILDFMLPGLDGLEICRQVRNDYHGPILMFTARDDSVEQVVGLELGADDYVTKPVEPRLLLARIRALLRHAHRVSSLSSDRQNRILSFGRLTINYSDRHVVWKNEEVACTEVEFELFWLLANHAGKIVSRERIFQSLNGYQYDGLDRSVDIRISRIRKKFEEDTANPARIKTVRGKGYLFIDSAWN